MFVVIIVVSVSKADSIVKGRATRQLGRLMGACSISISIVLAGESCALALSPAVRMTSGRSSALDDVGDGSCRVSSCYYPLVSF